MRTAPEGARSSTRRDRQNMRVEIDQVWATPSTLHVRAIVHDDNGRWRHKYYPSIPLAEIPEEALVMLTQAYLDQPVDEEANMEPLF